MTLTSQIRLDRHIDRQVYKQNRNSQGMEETQIDIIIM